MKALTHGMDVDYVFLGTKRDKRRGGGGVVRRSA
jgi:hypothetical protein